MPKWIMVECGVPTLVDDLPNIRPNRLGLISRFWEQEHAFSPEAHYAFAVPDPPTFNWLQTAAAHLFYNPRVTIKGSWTRIAPFSAEALVALVEQGLATDDDIIQQWFGADQVLTLLRAASGFDDLVLAVDAINGGHEISTETRRYVERVLGVDW